MKKSNKKSAARLKGQDWLTSKEVKKLFSVLGDEARFVGGCVRDALLKKPLKDLDLATSYEPDHVMKLLRNEGIKVIPTGLKHGTVTAIIGNKTFEITTLRKDLYCDGRHAEVEFTDNWKEDAARRDFTMNALYADRNGKIYDYFSGLDDLKKGVVRFIGNARDRVNEDYLRILRFFRFSAFYSRQKKLDKAGLEACAYLAHNLNRLSGERIQAEMLKLLSSPDPVFVLSIMEETGILKYLLPGKLNNLAFLKEVENENGIKRFIPDPVFRLAYILYFSVLREDDIKELGIGWKLSNEHKTRLLHALLPKFSVDSSTPVALQKKILRHIDEQYFKDIVRLKWAKELAEKKKSAAIIRKKFLNMLKLADIWQPPVFPVRGDDLIKLGIKPSKDLGKLLQWAENWWEENGYKPDKKTILKQVQQYKTAI